MTPMHGEIGTLVLLFVIGSLLIGAAVRHLLKGTPIPYTVALLLIGLGIGSLQRSDFFTYQIPMLAHMLEEVANVDPHLILFLFLPTLLFESASAMEFHLFKRLFTQIATLAVPGMMVCALATAVLAKYLFPWDWSWPVAFRRRLLETERKNYWTQFNNASISRLATNKLIEAVEHALAIITPGTVEVLQQREGKSTVTDILGPGSAIAADGLFISKEQLTFKAAVAVDAVWLAKGQLKPLMRKEPKLALILWKLRGDFHLGFA